jgi:hypothetical protein
MYFAHLVSYCDDPQLFVLTDWAEYLPQSWLLSSEWRGRWNVRYDLLSEFPFGTCLGTSESCRTLLDSVWMEASGRPNVRSCLRLSLARCACVGLLRLFWTRMRKSNVLFSPMLWRNTNAMWDMAHATNVLAWVRRDAQFCCKGRYVKSVRKFTHFMLATRYVKWHSIYDTTYNA